MAVKEQCINCRHCVRNIHNTSVDYCVLKATNIVYDKKSCEKFEERCNELMAKFAKFNTEGSNYTNSAFEHPLNLKREKKSRNIFSFDGRVGRAEYWFILLLCCLWFFVVYVVFVRLPVSPLYDFLVRLTHTFVCVWLVLAQNTKRLHDIGYSGFWQLVPFSFLWFGFAKGDEYTNSYGNPPK